MTNEKMVVNQETWNKISPDDRAWILYNTMLDIEERLKRLENRSFFNKTLAFLGGIFGGIVSVFGSKAMSN